MGKARARREYTIEDKARALVLQDTEQNQSEVSRQTGIPLTTINAWVNGIGITPDITEFRNVIKQRLASLCEVIALDNLTYLLGQRESKREEASYYQLAGSTGLLIDKALLLRGDATAITQTAMLTPEQQAQAIADLFQSVRERIQTGPVSVDADVSVPDTDTST